MPGELPGLKSVANATAAPASISCLAGARPARPRNIMVPGNSTARVSLAFPKAQMPAGEMAAK